MPNTIQVNLPEGAVRTLAHVPAINLAAFFDISLKEAIELQDEIFEGLDILAKKKQEDE